jgi:hypothetical protein
MDQEPKRTASDLLLSLEAKVNQLMQMHRNLDLNVKIVSNKLNHMIEAFTNTNESIGSPSLDPHAIATAPPSFQNPEGFKMNIQDEFSPPKEMGLPIDAAPVGFRRTSRPEAYSSVSPEQKNTPTPSIPQPLMQPAKLMQSSTLHIPSAANRSPVMQRIVDKNGKSLFMAQVEIVNAQSNLVEAKTRTNGTGKWQATLLPGNYKITIRKNEAANKQNIEVTQNITIDANTPNELPMLIVKGKE